MRLLNHLMCLVIIAALLVASVTHAGSVDEEAQKLAYSLSLDKAVVVILYKDQYGTGWFVSRNYIVTAAHVVGYTQGARVEVIHGTYRCEGITLHVDRAHDVAVIRVSKPWPEAKILSVATEVRKGMQIMVIGYPFELYQLMGNMEAMSNNPRASFGHVNWVDTMKDIFEIGARTDAGNSGGPIIEMSRDAVVGIVSFALHGEVATLYYGTACDAIVKDLSAWNIPFHAVKVEQAATPTPAGMNYRPSHAPVITAVAGGAAVLMLGVLIGMGIGGRRK